MEGRAMSGFTKLVPEIIQSSIWNEPSDVRIVWITLLAMKDENGYVQGDARTIARLANVPTESAEEALRVFQAPDEGSKTPDNDGRRIMRLSGGWIVLNHDIYRAHDDIKREQTRERVRKHRAKAKERDDVTQCNVTGALPSASVSASPSVSVSSKKGDARGEQFEQAWSAFGKYGVKKAAKGYWGAYTPDDQAKILAAIPPYLDCVAAGRSKSQFEGWLNPRNRKWDMDWTLALADLTKGEAPQVDVVEQRKIAKEKRDAAAFDKVVQEIVKQLDGTRPEDRDELIDLFKDKYADVPYLKGIAPWEEAHRRVQRGK